MLENDELDIEQAGITYNEHVKLGRVTTLTQYGVLGNQLDFAGTLVSSGEVEVRVEAVKTGGKSIVTRVAKYNISD
ncbi:MAG: hypothetical protein ACN6O6_17875 [Pseudomonas sp.]|uniref:hypothetical protein n=1 Tax=Pseudomonas sp. TaxID=306 RepID=UPI003D09B5EE